MNKRILICIIFLNFSVLGRAVPVVSGTNNSIVNSSVDPIFISGTGNTINSSSIVNVYGFTHNLTNSTFIGTFGSDATVTGSHHSYVFGGYNSLSSTDTCAIYGYNSSIASASASSSLGVNNVIQGGDHDFNIGTDNKIINSTNTVALNRYNILTSIATAGVLGYNNQASNSDNVYILGASNTVQGMQGTNTGNFYLLGNGLNMGTNSFPTSLSRMVIVMGVNNKEIPISGDSSVDTSPLFILANGNGATGARSNAIVTLKSGQTTITNRNFISPTTQNPTPTQPQALIVEGSATVKGTLSLQQRQGDIWMGSFGRTEDQGPSN